MKATSIAAIRRHKNILRLALATVLILLVPLLAMRFTDEVAWGPADFIIAGILLFGTGLAYELLAGKAHSVTYRIIIGMVLAGLLLLIWAELAVGVFGTPLAGD